MYLSTLTAAYCRPGSCLDPKHQSETQPCWVLWVSSSVRLSSLNVWNGISLIWTHLIFFLFIHRITFTVLFWYTYFRSDKPTFTIYLYLSHLMVSSWWAGSYLISLNSQKSTAPNREEVTMPKESNLGWSDFQSVYFMVMKGIMLLL